MGQPLYPSSCVDIARKRKKLAPEPSTAFKAFSKAVFSGGALPATSRQSIAVAVAHVTQSPFCMHEHAEAALKSGAAEQEIMEAIRVAAEMRAGTAYAHSALAIDTMTHSGE